jgi:hypothetical protein
MIIGILVGGVFGAFLGYLVLPDLSFLTALAGAYIGLKFLGTGTRTRSFGDNDYWDDDRNTGWGDDDDGGGDD